MSVDGLGQERTEGWGEDVPAVEEEPTGRRIKLTPASEIDMAPVRWLWDTTPPGAPPTSHGRVPTNSLCVVAGGPGIGKSQFSAWMAAHITKGTLPGELRGRPHSVIYGATEDSWRYTIKPRLVASGADLDHVYRIDVVEEDTPFARLTLPNDVPSLREVVAEYDVSLVILDPLLSFINERVNDYKAAEVRHTLEPLVKAADECGFTILGLAHFTKSGGNDPLARVAGSGAFGQLMRSLLAFAKEETDEGFEYVMSQAKNNLGSESLPSYTYEIQPVTVDTPTGPSYVSRFVLGEESSTSVRDAMRAEAEGGESSSMVAEWLRGKLADEGGSMRLSEIRLAAKKETFSDSSLNRAKRKLGLKAKVAGFGKGKGATWFLPEAVPEEPEAHYAQGDDRIGGIGADLGFCQESM